MLMKDVLGFHKNYYARMRGIFTSLSNFFRRELRPQSYPVVFDQHTGQCLPRRRLSDHAALANSENELLIADVS